MKKVIYSILGLSTAILLIGSVFNNVLKSNKEMVNGELMYSTTHLNVRSKPSVDARKVKTLEPNTPLIVTLSENDKWMIVANLDSIQIGFASSSYLSSNKIDYIVKKQKTANENEDLEKSLAKFKELYEELLEFKSNTNFIEYGFGLGGEYNSWLQRVKKFQKSHDSKTLINRGFFAAELTQLGLEYVKTKGSENKRTAYLNNLFKKGLKSDNITETLGLEDSKVIVDKSNDILIYRWIPLDKWNISFKYIEQYKTVSGKHYLKSIYSDGSQGIDNVKITNTKRKVRYDYDNNHGEYYILNRNGNLELYDGGNEVAMSFGKTN